VRAFRITQAQLDEIFESLGHYGRVYDILANLEVINEMVMDKPSSIPNVRVTVEGRKHPPVHETVGMWGEPKEEPLPDYRPGQPGGEDLADDPNVQWELDDDRTPGTFRIVKKRPETKQDFFYGKTLEYKMDRKDFEQEYLTIPTSHDDALDALNAVHKAEMEEREYARAMKAKHAEAQSERLKRLRADVAYWKSEVQIHERKIFAKIDSGSSANEYDLEVMQSTHNLLAEAEKALNHELTIMWAGK
jgi:hypothetical protein